MTCAVPWTVAKKTASAAVWFQLGPGRLNDNPLRRGARQIKPAKDSGTAVRPSGGYIRQVGFTTHDPEHDCRNYGDVKRLFNSSSRLWSPSRIESRRPYTNRRF
jgi:hypothetical protein